MMPDDIKDMLGVKDLSDPEPSIDAADPSGTGRKEAEHMTDVSASPHWIQRVVSAMATAKAKQEEEKLTVALNTQTWASGGLSVGSGGGGGPTLGSNWPPATYGPTGRRDYRSTVGIPLAADSRSSVEQPFVLFRGAHVSVYSRNGIMAVPVHIEARGVRACVGISAFLNLLKGPETGLLVGRSSPVWLAPLFGWTAMVSCPVAMLGVLVDSVTRLGGRVHIVMRVE